MFVSLSSTSRLRKIDIEGGEEGRSEFYVQKKNFCVRLKGMPICIFVLPAFLGLET